jgi:hypothetical protein
VSASQQHGLLRLLRSSDNGGMPRQRYQDPEIKRSKNGTYYIRPWVDVATTKGLERKKKRIILGPASIGQRGAKAKKAEAMTLVNNADYVIKSQVLFSELVKHYREKHVAG